MYVVDDLFNLLLRLGELAFAAVVAGLTGDYLNNNPSNSDWVNARFIYTEVLAAISIFLAIIWLFPFSGAFIYWPIDLLISIAWFVAFGLLVNFVEPLNCGSVYYWGNVAQQTACQKLQADVAFTFLSAIFWLASALLGLWFIRRRVGGGTVRRRWYHSRV